VAGSKNKGFRNFSYSIWIKEKLRGSSRQLRRKEKAPSCLVSLGDFVSTN
jgi:hypothetical protein